MDTLSHGLWGGITVGTKSRRDYWVAFLCGVLPDLIPFGWTFVNLFLGLDHRRFGPPDASAIPSYVDQLYNITHSFVIFGVVFGIIWLFRKKPYLPMLGWLFHILLDMPTHSGAFFPTPIFWPLSSVHVNGTPWITPWIFISNWVALALLYGFWFWRKRKQKKIPSI